MNTSQIAEDVSVEDPRTWLDELDDMRHTAIGVLWERYQRGEYVATQGPSSRAKLELINSNNLHVRAYFDQSSGSLKDIDVRNVESADPKGVNFMGYNEKENCAAFRGEARLLEDFLAFAYGLVKNEHVEHAMKANSDVCFPEGGLEAGLDYDDFASQVEIVEYAMWLKVCPDDQAGNETMTIISIVKDGVQTFPQENHVSFGDTVENSSRESSSLSWPEEDFNEMGIDSVRGISSTPG